MSKMLAGAQARPPSTPTRPSSRARREREIIRFSQGQFCSNAATNAIAQLEVARVGGGAGERAGKSRMGGRSLASSADGLAGLLAFGAALANGRCCGTLVSERAKMDQPTLGLPFQFGVAIAESRQTRCSAAVAAKSGAKSTADARLLQ